MGDYVNCDSSEETTFKDSTLTDVGVELGTNSDTTRRVRGVRFLAELTISINHTSDSSPTVHSTCEEPSRLLDRGDEKRLQWDNHAANGVLAADC